LALTVGKRVRYKGYRHGLLVSTRWAASVAYE
jgi:hypothetical protein